MELGPATSVDYTMKVIQSTDVNEHLEFVSSGLQESLPFACSVKLLSSIVAFTQVGNL
jgi:hypothetical protein